MRSEQSKEQQRKYDKQMTRFIGLKLNRNTDADIIRWLEEQKNIQGYIKELIRKDKEAAEEEKEKEG